MPHVTPLIAILVVGFVLSFILGAIALRLRVSPIAGYLLAGVIMGPFTPGFVGDMKLAHELAEIGVILLMFGVGLHFSLKDLMDVRRIAVPGAVVQIAAATLMGMGLAAAMGWPVLAGFVFGLALSTASTVVLLRALQSLDLVETDKGRIAVGWLIVEDIAMVLALVLLPVLAGMDMSGGGGLSKLFWSLGVTLFMVGAFIAFMLVIGRRVIPVLLHWVVHTGSRELFRLAVLAIALGVAAFAAQVFHVSFALGAFFAGMILGETELSRRATEETLPLRDAFAVLFFVSVGMLFDPKVVVEQPLPLLATVLIIVFGKSIAAYAIVRLFRHSHNTALIIAASLAQIGEFSFILATLGTKLDIVPEAARDLILAGAIFSIFLNPFVFAFVKRGARNEETEGEPELTSPGSPVVTQTVLLVGFGRVGSLLGPELKTVGREVVVIEDDRDTAAQAEKMGLSVVKGSALEERTLLAAGIQKADTLLVAIAHGFEAGAIVEKARGLRPDLPIIARAHSDEEVAHLKRKGAGQVVMGEQELARRMLELARGSA